MARRTILVICALIALMFFVVLAQSPLLAYSMHASPTSSSLLAAAPSPTATSTPTIAETISSTEKVVFDPILAALSFAAALLISVLLILLLVRIWKLVHVSNLVVDTFANATGNANLDPILPGLNQLTRETLTQVLEEVRQRIQKRSDTSSPLEQFPAYNPRQFPVPGQAVDDRLTNLLTSLKDVTTGEVQTAVQLLNLVFTPRGTKVRATLQSRGNTPATLGISLEIIDLRSKREPILLTIWEAPFLPEAVADEDDEDRQGEDKDAQACYTLGQLYEWRGALDEAKTQYEDALAKQPDYPKARDALRRILAIIRTPEERYLSLRAPAARWLAIEVAQRSLEGGRHNKSYQAKLYNFIGLFHQASAQTFSQSLFFYDLAIKDFTKASEMEETWFQPYENLADTYVIMAQGTMAQRRTGEEMEAEELLRSWTEIVGDEGQRKISIPFSPLYIVSPRVPWTPPTGGDKRTEAKVQPWQPCTEDIEHLYKALIMYDEAWERFEQNGRKQEGLLEDERTRRRIQLGKCTALLLSGDTDLVVKAIEGVKKIQHGWDIAEEKESHLVYNLACWYGIADHQQIDFKDVTANTSVAGQSAKQVARLYLAYSLARDQELWGWAPYDPSLSSTFSLQEWSNLTRTLSKHIYLLRDATLPKDLSKMGKTEFATTVTAILHEAGWKEKEKRNSS